MRNPKIVRYHWLAPNYQYIKTNHFIFTKALLGLEPCIPITVKPDLSHYWRFSKLKLTGYFSYFNSSEDVGFWQIYYFSVISPTQF